MALAERAQELLHGLPRGWRRLGSSSPWTSRRRRTGPLILGPAAPGRTANRFVLNVYAGRGSSVRRPMWPGACWPGSTGRGFAGGFRSWRPTETSRRRLRRRSTRRRWMGAPRLRRRGRLRRAGRRSWTRSPPDWSHCYAEIVLDSSDFLERAALLLAPANPLRPDARPTILRFRAARVVGYGISAGMARRCFERLDAEAITGRVAVLRVVSEDRPVGQGPVWRIGGQSL